MTADLTSGIVRVLRPDHETAGTSFVVAENLAVTCAHVLPAAAQPKAGRAGADVELVFRAGSQRPWLRWSRIGSGPLMPRTWHS